MSIATVSSVSGGSPTPGAADFSHPSPADVARANIKAHGVEPYGVPHALDATADSVAMSSSVTQAALPALYLGG